MKNIENIIFSLLFNFSRDPIYQIMVRIQYICLFVFFGIENEDEKNLWFKCNVGLCLVWFVCQEQKK